MIASGRDAIVLVGTEIKIEVKIEIKLEIKIGIKVVSLNTGMKIPDVILPRKESVKERRDGLEFYLLLWYFYLL
jgi:hypothetical protein